MIDESSVPAIDYCLFLFN